MPQNDTACDQPLCDQQMLEVLKKMLRENVTITARAVAREHPSVQHASSITRSAGRADLLAKFQQQQREVRSLSLQVGKISRHRITADLAEKDQRIGELERQLQVLQVVVIGMIRVVGELGGMSRLLQLFEGYREVQNQLNKLRVRSEPLVKVIREANGDEATETGS